MKHNIPSSESSDFFGKILAELAEIKRRLDAKGPILSQPLDKYYQPKELMDIYGISRNTLEKFFQADLLTPLRLSPDSRKIYVAESQMLAIFKSQLPQNRK